MVNMARPRDSMTNGETFAWIFISFFVLMMGLWMTLLSHWLVYFAQLEFLHISLFVCGWLYLDREAAGLGNRCSKRFRRWNPLGRWIASLLPVKLVKTVDLDPNGKYIFGVHPHGAVALLSTFVSEATGFSELFPGLDMHMVVMDYHFSVPLFKEYFSHSGAISSSPEAIDHVLGRGSGKIVAIAVGGGYELIDAHPGTMVLTLKKRKGFVKKALKHGASLVPVLNFGDNDLLHQYPNPPGSQWRKMQDLIQRLFHRYLSPVTFHGKYYGLATIAPCHTVVGSPIEVPKMENPTQEEIDSVHAKYVKAVEDLFDKHAEKYSNYPDMKLDIRY
ncbi:2-acylglycerol O-acyltransferase 1-like [Tubulanus polymorphus]|uniref:2-acylglycerol O-acyltransferase 1-like n=1 Tax=Tubulanus polymorphus TaxID=672921 RepID=UPI003DA36C59